MRASKDDGSWLWGQREQHVHRLVHESMGALGTAAGPVGKGWGLWWHQNLLPSYPEASGK